MAVFSLVRIAAKPSRSDQPENLARMLLQASCPMANKFATGRFEPRTQTTPDLMLYSIGRFT